MVAMGPGIRFRAGGTLVSLPLISPIVLTVVVSGFGVGGVPELVAALALCLGAIVLHEVARLAAYRALGVRVRGLTLLVAAGAPRPRMASNRPAAELAAGLTGLAVAAAAALLALLLWWRGLAPAAVVGLLAIAVAQTLPILPLDGGRLLAAIAWSVSEDPVAAVRVPATYGGALAFGVAIAGVPMLGAGGSWPYWGFAGIVFGAQLVGVSVVTLRDSRTEAAAADVALGELGLPHAQRLGPEATLADAAALLLARDPPSFLIAFHGVQPLGVMTVARLRRVARREWSELSAASAAIPLTDLPTVQATDSALAALDALDIARHGIILVVTDDRHGTTLLDTGSLASAIRTHERERLRMP